VPLLNPPARPLVIKSRAYAGSRLRPPSGWPLAAASIFFTPTTSRWRMCRAQPTVNLGTYTTFSRCVRQQGLFAVLELFALIYVSSALFAYRGKHLGIDALCRRGSGLGCSCSLTLKISRQSLHGAGIARRRRTSCHLLTQADGPGLNSLTAISGLVIHSCRS